MVYLMPKLSFQKNSSGPIQPITRDGYKGVPTVIFWPFDPAQNAIQGDAPEGSDTF